MDEDMIKKIRESAENLEFPENLSPDKIETLLSKQKQKKKKTISIFRFAAAAAVLAVLLVPAVYNMGIFTPKEDNNGVAALRSQPLTEGTFAASGAAGNREVSQPFFTARNMEELQAYVDTSKEQMQAAPEVSGESAVKIEAMDLLLENAANTSMETLDNSEFGALGQIRLQDDVLWFYQEGTGLTAVRSDEGKLSMTGQIPDGANGRITAFYPAKNSLLTVRTQEQELLAQIYQPDEAGKWTEVWSTVSVGEFEDIDYDGTYFYISMRCYPTAGEESKVFLPTVGGTRLDLAEIYLLDGTVDNMYAAAFSVNSLNPTQVRSAGAVFAGGEAELQYSQGEIIPETTSAHEATAEAGSGRFETESAKIDGQPALKVAFIDPSLDEVGKELAVTSIPEYSAGVGQTVQYASEYAVIPALSSQGAEVLLVVSWDSAKGLALERIIEPKGTIQAVLCAEGYIYLLTDKTLQCYNRTACGLAGELTFDK